MLIYWQGVNITLQSSDYVNLLNCTARFINYGKHNVLSIFEWEQEHLSKQTDKQAVLLKSYKKWSEIENKIISGKGVELDIDGCEEKIRFFDVNQTVDPKFGRKAKQNTDSIPKEELAEIPSTDPIEIDFSHKHRGLLLTALWTELSIFQNEYEKSVGGNNESILSHISVIYIVHSHFKSNWQNDNEVKAIFDTFYNEYKENTEKPETSAKAHLLGSFFSQLFQSAINMIVKIEKRFETLVSDSDSEASENYYMKIRFYDICDNEKVAVCRLKPTEKVNANLSIESYEIIETLPYKPDMEREAFLEYLQSVFNNGLTEEHIVLVRRKNIYGATIVATYRVDVRNWGVKQEYINFNIVASHYPISFYLRQISSEYLEKAEDGGAGNEVPSKSQPQEKAKTNQKTEPHSSVATTKVDSGEPETAKETDMPQDLPQTLIEETENIEPSKVNQTKKKPPKKKRTDILNKVNKLKEDMQNKSC